MSTIHRVWQSKNEADKCDFYNAVQIDPKTGKYGIQNWIELEMNMKHMMELLSSGDEVQLLIDAPEEEIQRSWNVTVIQKLVDHDSSWPVFLGCVYSYHSGESGINNGDFVIFNTVHGIDVSTNTEKWKQFLPKGWINRYPRKTD